MSPRIYLQGYWTPSAGLVLIIDFPSPVDPAVTGKSDPVHYFDLLQLQQIMDFGHLEK
jgi:hypothetical protein